MRVGSLFAGIGGFDFGFERAGHETVWQVELDEKCREVLARRFPRAERFADIRECGAHNLAPVDVVCGGFPCQDLSVAGQRAGLAGERSGLFYEMTRIVDELKPTWLVWENVPGLLSSHRGADFARVLVELERIGYLGAWTTLDARYFGVAQRRRRIFGVFTRLDSGAERAAEVLALAARLRGNPPPRGEAGADVAGTLGGGAPGRGRRDNPDSSGAFVANTVRPGDGTGDFRGDGCDNFVSYALRSDPGGTGQGHNTNYVIPEVADPILHCEGRTYTQEGSGNFRLHNVVPRVAWALQERDSKGTDSDTKDGHLIPLNIVGNGQQGKSHAYPSDATGALQHKGNAATGNEAGTVLASMLGVRRLTPTECERLQGFPDGWTEGHADSHRYRMLGNAVAVPCAAWIGSRLARD